MWHVMANYRPIPCDNLPRQRPPELAPGRYRRACYGNCLWAVRGARGACWNWGGPWGRRRSWLKNNGTWKSHTILAWLIMIEIWDVLFCCSFMEICKLVRSVQFCLEEHTILILPPKRIWTLPFKDDWTGCSFHSFGGQNECTASNR